MKHPNLYLTGAYSSNNPGWHSADSPWKASKALPLLKNNLPSPPLSVLEVGCGSGVFLDSLAVDSFFKGTSFLATTFHQM